MSKRKATPDIGSLLGGGKSQTTRPPEVQAEPVKKQDKPGKQCLHGLQDKPSVQQGLRDEWTRATFIVREDLLEQLKALAFFRRTPLKALMDAILTGYLKRQNIEEALDLYRKK